MGAQVVASTAQIRTFNREGECTLHIDGTINENTNFSDISLSGAKKLTLDLEHVMGLNSMGLRNWVMWVKGLKSTAQIYFRHCTRPVVDQMNILEGFLPMGAVVESFFVPYHCDSCGHDENYLATRGKDFMEATVDVKEGVHIPEEKPCPVCAGKMNYDIIAKKYFGFLRYRR